MKSMAGAVLSRIRRAAFFVSGYEGGSQAKTLRMPMFSCFRTEKRGFSENANVCVFLCSFGCARNFMVAAFGLRV